jgi:hypothetical protein
MTSDVQYTLNFKVTGKIMIIWAFNLLILATGILIVGLINPKWILFWWEKKEPKRMFVIGISVAIFMGSAILFGEGNRLNQPLSAIANKGKIIIKPTESPADLVAK